MVKIGPNGFFHVGQFCPDRSHFAPVSADVVVVAHEYRVARVEGFGIYALLAPSRAAISRDREVGVRLVVFGGVATVVEYGVEVA